MRSVSGDEQTHWLSTPFAILGNRTPTDLLASNEGLALVEQTLGADRTQYPILMGRREYRVCRARYARLDGEGAKHVEADGIHSD